MIAAALAAAVVLLGALRRVDVYAAFIEGAQQGLKVALRVAPYLCAALMLIGALRGSGLLALLESLLAPLLERMGIPVELIPFLVMRPVSGAGALTALRDLIARCGPDSRAATLASAMMGSSETVLYVLSLYLGSVRLPSARYTLWAALLSMLAGLAVVVWIVG